MRKKCEEYGNSSTYNDLIINSFTFKKKRATPTYANAYAVILFISYVLINDRKLRQNRSNSDHDVLLILAYNNNVKTCIFTC